MEDDKEKVEQICGANNCDVQFIVAEESKTELRQEKDTITIIDEVDAVLLDKALKFTRKDSQTYPLKVIGLTATSLNEFIEYEKNYITSLGFEVIDSKIEASFNSPPQVASWDVIFGSKCDGMARLIFTEEAEVGKLESMAQSTMKNFGGSVMKNESDLSVIRKMGPNTVWFVTDPALMRGFDYFCETGIALVIDKKLSSERDYKQALGRC